jgi:hypothetical protein
MLGSKDGGLATYSLQVIVGYYSGKQSKMMQTSTFRRVKGNRMWASKVKHGLGDKSGIPALSGDLIGNGVNLH